MRTVKEVSKLTGVSIRTLQYYDKIGLLKPTQYTQSGYRLYDDTALEMLQQILLFRELKFPLKEIKEMISRPGFDRDKALEQQIALLTMKKEHLENLIDFAREIQLIGGKTMDFSVFDTSKMDEYARQAKEQWGKTPEYKEFEQKAQNRSKEEERLIMEKFTQLFQEFGELKENGLETARVQDQVKKLQDFITQNYYQCSNEILSGLGQMYGKGGEFTENIDRMGGTGTAEFVAGAIRIYCGK
ncbi:MerR family transcriptional regulator [Parablautia muri]|uniref:MerR family transcriptional regulator n=1 Tax=Parablautia muri TaxID=2320879 RepID=A0A9X5BFF4_9FIRM|nr:MerR family transcriptional regulator [Parablautia muri]NBJ92940.1 MerR family transcriptional regulator [Parablautia muri]